MELPELGHAHWGKKVEVSVLSPRSKLRTTWACFRSIYCLVDEIMDRKQNRHIPTRMVLIVFRSNCQTKDAGNPHCFWDPAWSTCSFCKLSDLPTWIQMKAH